MHRRASLMQLEIARWDLLRGYPYVYWFYVEKIIAQRIKSTPGMCDKKLYLWIGRGGKSYQNSHLF